MPKSFDLFDTLLGRLHHRPDSIFSLVEKEFPFPGFRFFRLAAELQSNKTLPDIYRHFRQWTGVDASLADQLMRYEYEVELSQIFPICENIAQVQDGDLIVSDTYYDEAQLRQILEKIGLKKQVHVYATPRGKSSGSLWPTLIQKHAPSSHLGDSLHADVAMARSAGLDAVHYKNSQLTSREQKIVSRDKEDLAHLMRALRLQNPYPPNSPESLFWLDQSQINIPILIEASLYLHDFCQEKNKKRILFTSRDGCLWIQIFRALFPQYESLYFHASRYTYLSPSPSYIDYVKGLYTEDTVIVDSHGKGRTCRTFFEKHFHSEPLYLAIVNSSRRHHGILRSKRLCTEIEKLNYDLCGTLYDVQNGQPLRSEPEYDVRYIRSAHACVEKCIELLPHYRFGLFDRKIIASLVRSMRSQIAFDRYLKHARFHCHLQEGATLHHIHVL